MTVNRKLYENPPSIMKKGGYRKEGTLAYEIEKEPQATYCILKIVNDKMILEKDGRILGLCINYEGAADIHVSLPDGWIINEGLNQILIYTGGTQDLEEELFTFSGVIKLKNMEYVTSELKLKRGKCKNAVLNHWNLMALEDPFISNDAQLWNNLESSYNSLNKSFMARDAEKNFKVRKDSSRRTRIFKDGKEVKRMTIKVPKNKIDNITIKAPKKRVYGPVKKSVKMAETNKGY
tara:strand:+ start:258 stop:962 length:705 start_codon:yes stop_codon:yes gene_type:complete